MCQTQFLLIEEVERYPSYRHLASYNGLAPIRDETAGREGARHCSAAGNRILRWALVEAVHGAAGCCPNT